MAGGLLTGITKVILVGPKVEKEVLLKHVSDHSTSLRLRQSNCGSSIPCWLFPNISAFLLLIMNMGQKCVLDYQTYSVSSLFSLSHIAPVGLPSGTPFCLFLCVQYSFCQFLVHVLFIH